MTQINADTLLGDRSLRNQYSDRVEVLDEVKELPVLKGDVVTIQIVTDYYEVSKATVTRLINENKDELLSVGLTILEGEALKRFKEAQRSGGNKSAFLKINTLTVLPRQAVLRLGMLLPESEVAKELRFHLLGKEEVVANVHAPLEKVDNQDVSQVANQDASDVSDDVINTVNTAIKFQHETVQLFIQQQNELLRQLLVGNPR